MRDIALAMGERRKYNRNKIKFFSRVYDRKTKQLIGYLVDLSSNGAMLISQTRLLPQEILHLQMDLPENFNKSHLFLTGQIVWSEKDGISDLFKTGVQWINTSPEDISFLSKLIKEFGISHQT